MNELAHLHGARHGRALQALVRMALGCERRVKEGQRTATWVCQSEALARWAEDRFAEVARKVGCRVEHTEGLHVTVDGLEVRFVGPEGAGGRGVVTSSGEDG